MDIKYLSTKDVIIVHFLVMKKHGEGEQAGIKVQSLLDSAVHRPQQSAYLNDAYPTLFEKASALFESLARNHCFYNGNKRTALDRKSTRLNSSHVAISYAVFCF